MTASTTNVETWNEDEKSAAVKQGLGGEHDVVDCWDVATFEEAVGRCEDRAYRLAVHLVRNERVAQEILQETLLAAWRNTPSFASRTQLSTWVYRATVRCALGRSQSANGRGPSHNDDFLLSLSTISRFCRRGNWQEGPDWSVFSPRQLSSEDLFRRIRQTVDVMPTHLRAAFVLCDLEEISAEDSAEILDVPVATAKENLHAARMAIHHAIGRHFSRRGRDGLGRDCYLLR